MLVLTRRAGESVMIDGHIEIKVLRIRGNQVHLGIDAPTETMVNRHEVWVRLQQDAADGVGAAAGGKVPPVNGIAPEACAQAPVVHEDGLAVEVVTPDPMR